MLFFTLFSCGPSQDQVNKLSSGKKKKSCFFFFSFLLTPGRSLYGLSIHCNDSQQRNTIHVFFFIISECFSYLLLCYKWSQNLVAKKIIIIIFSLKILWFTGFFWWFIYSLWCWLELQSHRGSTGLECSRELFHISDVWWRTTRELGSDSWTPLSHGHVSSRKTPYVAA